MQNGHTPKAICLWSTESTRSMHRDSQHPVIVWDVLLRLLLRLYKDSLAHSTTWGRLKAKVWVLAQAAVFLLELPGARGRCQSWDLEEKAGETLVKVQLPRKINYSTCLSTGMALLDKQHPCMDVHHSDRRDYRWRWHGEQAVTKNTYIKIIKIKALKSFSGQFKVAHFAIPRLSYLWLLNYP